MPHADETPTLPANVEAERALLGTILSHPEALSGASAIPASGAAFHEPKHGRVWRAIHALEAAGAVPDTRTVAAILYQRDDADIVPYMASLVDCAGAIKSVPWYARQILDAWRKRDALHGLEAAEEEARNGGSPAQLAALVDTISLSLRDPIGERSLRILAPVDVLTKDPEPIAWLAEGWLAEGDAAILGGEWGTGKTLAALDLAIAFATGGQWMGLVSCRCVPVIYVDEENSPRNVQRRFRQLLVGHNVDEADARGMPLTYLSRNGLSLDDAAGLLTLNRLIEQTQARVVILDSLVRFFHGDENSNSEVARFFSRAIAPILARHDASVLMLDHMRKPSANPKHDSDPGHRLRGASDKAGYVDELWCLEGDRASNRRTLRHEKARTDQSQAALSLSWEVSDDGTAASIVAVEERAGAADVAVATLRQSAEAGSTKGELVSALQGAGFTLRGTEAAIGKLHGQGTIRKAREGQRGVRYWLATFAPDGAV